MTKSLASPITADEFAVGERVQLHPATDLWMRGARYGVVTAIGRKYVSVRLDLLPARPRKFRPDNVMHI